MGKLNRRISIKQEIFEYFDEKHCFVCNKKFTDKDLKSGKRMYIGKNKNHDLYRHKKCDPLSDKWIEKFGKPIIKI